MTELRARPAAQSIARIVAVVGTVATGIFYFPVALIGPMPWPWVFGLVWLGFVIATIIAARRWSYRPLVLTVMSFVFGVGGVWIGQTFVHWAP